MQLVNRPPPYGTNPGRGNVRLANGRIVDTNLEDGGGGSSLHFAGGAPDSTYLVQDTQILLGCDPQLAMPFANNITGGIACEDGDPTFPGGIGCLDLHRFASIVGRVFPGRRNARRSNVRVGNAKVFKMRSVYLEQDPQAHQFALEILPSCGEVQISKDCEVVGQVAYRGEPLRTWRDFRAAHPELFD